MVKLLENTFRAVNIGLVNELALMCRSLGIDVWEIIDAAATKPFGFMPFYPGPGLGGHCIPIDPLYLSWKARLSGFEPRFIDLANQVNSDDATGRGLLDGQRRPQSTAAGSLKGSLDPRPGRQLQARRQRRARVTGHRDPRRSSRSAGGCGDVSRPVRAGA